MQLLIEPSGEIRCVYGEEIELGSLGAVSIQRGSHVEPDELGRWWADLSPVTGPKLGPFTQRAAAIAAEIEWLERFWLVNPTD